MKKKGQVLVVFLWVLMILIVYVVSATAKARGVLAYARRQTDAQQALSLARAGVQRAISELEADTNSYDTLQETWANNEDIFSRMIMGQEPAGTAEVSYRDIESGESVFGVRDEERKIDINRASETLLTVLAEKCGAADPAGAARNILIWRQEGIPESAAYKNLGYPPKRAKFMVPEECKLVPGISEEDYLKLENFITVYTQGRININTITQDALSVVTEAIARPLGIGADAARGLAESIISSRKEHNGYFQGKADIPVPLSAAEKEIYLRLLEAVVFTSNVFLIEAKGNVGGTQKKMTVVYRRGPGEKGVLYWHES